MDGWQALRIYAKLRVRADDYAKCFEITRKPGTSVLADYMAV